MTAITLADLTQVKLDGTGAFDALMRAAKIHLEYQYNQGTIRGPEYATVYLGQLESSMQTALSFLINREKVGLEAALLEKQIALAEVELQKANVQLAIMQEEAQTAVVQRALAQAQVDKVRADISLVQAQLANVTAEHELIQKNAARVAAETLNVPKQGALVDAQVAVAVQQGINAEVEKRVLEGQVCKLQAEYDYTQQNTLKSAGEVTLLAQKTATEKAQILGLGVDEDSVIGRQKALFSAQTRGFQRDAEQKAANLYVDIYKTFRMTDNEFPIPAIFDATNLTQVVNIVKAGINAPAS